jgi:hypothetical protein
MTREDLRSILVEIMTRLHEKPIPSSACFQNDGECDSSCDCDCDLNPCDVTTFYGIAEEG